MAIMTTREAINMVLVAELARDAKTLYMGEIVRRAGATGACYGLYDQFGPAQVIETPVSENGIFGAGLGLALSGYRPILEIYSADFILAVGNEVMNDMAKWRQQHNQQKLPITIRGWMGAGAGRGPEHSQCMEAFLHHAPGLTVVVPGSPADMAGLLRASIRTDTPVVFLEHRKLYPLRAEVPEDPDYSVPLGKGDVVRSGKDITIVAWGWMRHEALSAAETLAAEGICAEVVDPRTIKPLDMNLIVASVQRTGRLLVAEESFRTGSVAAEIITGVNERLDIPAPARRVTLPDVIHPYSPSMERDILPVADDIARAARSLLSSRAGISTAISA